MSIDLDPGSGGQTVSRFFQYVQLPVLEHLDIRCDTWEILDISFVLNNLYERAPFSNLTSLHLQGITIHIDSFTNFLAVVPSMQALQLTRVSCFYEALFRNLVFSPKEKNPMLPHLHTVCIREQDIDTEVGTLVDLIESRWWIDADDSKGRPSLCSFRMDGGRFELEDKLTLWRSQGLNITLKEF